MASRQLLSRHPDRQHQCHLDPGPDLPGRVDALCQIGSSSPGLTVLTAGLQADRLRTVRQMGDCRGDPDLIFRFGRWPALLLQIGMQGLAGILLQQRFKPPGQGGRLGQQWP